MIKEDFEKIKYSEQFKAIVTGSYLVSCFLNDASDLWEYNFYSRETKNIYTFILDNNEIKLKDTNILLNEKENPEELFLGELKLNEKEAVAVLNYFLLRMYKDHKVSKVILSIEKNETIVWRIIVILKNLKVINVKIDDKTSEIIEDKLISPFNNS